MIPRGSAEGIIEVDVWKSQGTCSGGLFCPFLSSVQDREYRMFGHSPTIENLSQRLLTKLRECVLRVNNNTAAEEMWDTLLTRHQQIQLEDDLPAAWESHGGTIRLWQHIRRIESPYVAAVDLAQQLRLVDDRWAVRLFEALGDHAPLPLEDRPQWARSAGQIRFRGEAIRTVRTHQKPSNVEIVLDAFEQAGWPEQVPAPSGFDSAKVRETLRSLKNGLTAIEFRQREGGTKIQWHTVGS